MIDARELERIGDRAADLVLFADGVEDAGLPQLAQRARVAADDLARLVAELRDERAVRERAQELHGQTLRLLGKRAGEAAGAAARRGAA